MAKVRDMSIEDLEHLIEQKLLEIFGDPDSGLQINDEFRRKLQKRLSIHSPRVPHDEVIKRFG